MVGRVFGCRGLRGCPCGWMECGIVDLFTERDRTSGLAPIRDTFPDKAFLWVLLVLTFTT